MVMLARPRIRRIIDALLAWMLAPNLEWWNAISQERVDSSIETWDR